MVETDSSADMQSPAAQPAGEQPASAYDVQGLGTSVRIHADASVVEIVDEDVQVSLLIRGKEVRQVVWTEDRSQPSRVRLRRVVEETARVRLSQDAANDLAMNLLLEMAQAALLDEEALERNFQIIRDQLRARAEQDA